MRKLIGLAFGLALGACDPSPSERGSPSPPAVSAALTFEGAGASNTETRLAHGQRIAAVLGCTGCHGPDLTGEDWSEPGFGTLWTANLTRAVVKYSDAELARIIQSGATPKRPLWDMPSHLFTQLSAADMAALIGFLRSKAPTGADHPAPKFEKGGRKEIADGLFKPSIAVVAAEGQQWPPQAGEGHALGRYIVRATCAECHEMDLRGGQPNPEATPRPDLRLVAAYDLESFSRLMRTGKAAGDRELKLMSEVARHRYSQLTDTEVRAIHAYLQKVADVAP